MSFLILFGRASVNISEHWKLAEFEVKKMTVSSLNTLLAVNYQVVLDNILVKLSNPWCIVSPQF